jgi:predicted TIM-barrel fold metal-dependent hydrolase
MYNCHSHIFNSKCAPDRFIGVPIARLMSNNKISFWLVRGLRNIIKNDKDDFFEKYANFLEIGRKKSQELVFEDLRMNYPGSTRFIVLTIDMDYMGAGDAILNFRSQIHEVINIKRKYPNIFFPFLGIDPRRSDENNLLDFLKLHIEKLGFYGIKLYPGLGFYPFDPRLSKIYEYAENNHLPIIVHCTKRGIYYRGRNFTSEQLKPKNIDGEYLDAYDFTDQRHLKNSEFKNKFTDPSNYELVLKKFPALKICFAHLGGNDEIKEYLKKASTDNWYFKVKNLMKDYQNVYTDISYTLYDHEVFDTLKNDIKDNSIRNKILFGTDFFMTIREKPESILVRDFRQIITEQDFDLISQQNPRQFLKSRFFNL